MTNEPTPSRGAQVRRFPLEPTPVRVSKEVLADLWHSLMAGILGYDRYAAAGCDVGALVCGQLGHKYAE